jgi:hypothetical protein
MDGYSVKEAATVLGVPKRRVWELIARGVLSGAPEGDAGMRVFLQPRPGRSAPLSAARDEPPRTNGNGGHSEALGEGSPFREILTEFRSLTERYGQALLALGEARGEVAALRSRVELLEARLDLRLPGPRASSMVAWGMPDYAPPAPPQPEPVIPESVVPDSAAAEPNGPEAGEPETAPPPFDSAEFATEFAGEPPEMLSPEESERVLAPEQERRPVETPRRRRALRTHSAIAGIAEALVRAQDPTLADLPGAREAAEALAALQHEVEVRNVTLDAGAAGGAEPPAGAGAEPRAGAEPAAGVGAVAAETAEEMHAAGEMQAIGDLETVDSSFVEPAAAVAADELVAEEPRQPIEPEEQPTWPEAASQPEPVAEPEPELMAEPEAASSEPELGPEFGAEASTEAAAATDVGTDAEAPTVTAEPTRGAIEAAASVYSTEVVEPDWFADGDITWLEAAQAESEAGQQAPPATAEPHAAPVPEVEGHAEEEARSAELGDHERAHAEATPAAEAIQDAFEEAEPEGQATEAAPAVQGVAQVAAVRGVEAEAAREPEPAGPQPVAQPEEVADVASATASEAEPAEPEAVAELEPIADLQAAPEVEAVAQVEAGKPDVMAEAEVEASSDYEAARKADAVADVETAAEEEPALPEPSMEPEASAAIKGIQDAFEPAPPEATAFAEEPEETVAAAALATPSEAPFTPDDVAVFAVRQPEAEAPRSDATETERDDGPPETRSEAPGPTQQPPTVAAPPRIGLGGLAVKASVPPKVEPSAPPVTPLPEEEELMWLGDEFEAAELEIATPGWRSQPEASVQPVHDAPLHEMSDSDLAQLAQDEGWEADEVEAIRTLLGRPAPAPPQERAEPTRSERTVALPVDAPPPDDVHPMDEGPAQSAASEATVLEQEPMPSIQPSEVEPTSAAAEPIDATADETAAEPAAEPPLSVEETIRRSIAAHTERSPGAPEPEWLQRRRGPAANAYRRLRRLLPG